MKSIDKNDVDISKLFNWGKEYTVVDINGDELLKVFIRLVGDAEFNRARVFGLRKSAELRKELRKKDSEFRIAFIPEMGELEDKNIIEAIVLNSISELTATAVRNLDLRYPKEVDSDASLEDQENYQLEVDNYPEQREKLIREAIDKEADKLRSELAKLSPENLYNRFEETIINEACEAEMISKYRQMCVYFGTYFDDSFKERVFKNFDEFDNLRKEIKFQLMEAYNELEINGDELKKLPEATP